jgi:hypothetical protein
MVVGAAITVLALLLLGFTRDFASLFTARDTPAVRQILLTGLDHQ